jgi:hypothetical protein
VDEGKKVMEGNYGRKEGSYERKLWKKGMHLWKEGEGRKVKEGRTV